MRIDRLVGIVSLLLQREKITAPELAAHFDVSRRTINRDIEALCKAGIPVCTTQGLGGGIYIMDGYRIDRTLLTSKEMQMIIAGLRSLDSVSGSSCASRLMEKLHAGSSGFVQGSDSILIDLSSPGRADLSQKIALIQTAIEQKQTIRFDYFSSKAEGPRTIDPYCLLFRWSSWYIWGFCHAKQDFRLFKLTRMDHLSNTGSAFEERAVPMPDLETAHFFPRETRLKAQFDASLRWYLIDSFGISSFQTQEDGSLLCEIDMDEAGLLAWLLSCGDKVTVLEPQSLREKLYSIASGIAARNVPQHRNPTTAVPTE